MKHLTNIPYNQVVFDFVHDHYDYNITGTCYFDNNLCWFKSGDSYWMEEDDEYSPIFVDIYSLNIFEKIKLKCEQKLFEYIVGYCWSYDRNGSKGDYIEPKSKFKKWLFKIYYEI